MKPSDLCSYYAPYLPFISHWHDTCNKFGFSPIEPCLHFVLAHSFIDKAIIGISPASQLREIVACISKESPRISSFSFSSFAHNSCELFACRWIDERN